MAERYSPTVRRRRLSIELHRIRKDAGLGFVDVAKRTKISRSTLNNIELGKKQKPTLKEVTAILDACGVEGTREREAILDLCRQSHVRGWWSRYGDVLPGQYVGFEAEAASITTWESLVVPGLLQAPEYVELIGNASLTKPADVQRNIKARAERQQILDDSNPPDLWAVFDETALLRLHEHPEVLHAQVEYLLRRVELPHVTVQLTRADRLHPGLAGPFVIMEFAEPIDPPIVYLETGVDGLYLEEYEHVAHYRQVCDHLRLVALRPEETTARLREMI